MDTRLEQRETDQMGIQTSVITKILSLSRIDNVKSIVFEWMRRLDGIWIRFGGFVSEKIGVTQRYLHCLLGPSFRRSDLAV